VDHSKLYLLYPALHQTCDEFGIKYEFEPWWKMATGMHKQLSRDKPSTYKERLLLRGEKTFAE